MLDSMPVSWVSAYPCWYLSVLVHEYYFLFNPQAPSTRRRTRTRFLSSCRGRRSRWAACSACRRGASRGGRTHEATTRRSSLLTPSQSDALRLAQDSLQRRCSRLLRLCQNSLRNDKSCSAYHSVLRCIDEFKQINPRVSSPCMQWQRHLLGQAGAQPGHDGLEMGHTLG